MMIGDPRKVVSNVIKDCEPHNALGSTHYGFASRHTNQCDFDGR